jgi:hypothetical protein
MIVRAKFDHRTPQDFARLLRILGDGVTEHHRGALAAPTASLNAR